MATKKAGGSTQLGRDSISKRLGVKLYAGQSAKSGNIIVRQRGQEIRAGKNVMEGKDFTLFSTIDGYVRFYNKFTKKFTGKLQKSKFVEVVPEKPKVTPDKDQMDKLKTAVERQDIASKTRKKKPAHLRPLPAGIRKRRVRKYNRNK